MAVHKVAGVRRTEKALHCHPGRLGSTGEGEVKNRPSSESMAEILLID